ncbi:MAG: alpha/beta fold hydrolase [Candidatus Eisenbacteria bacterium]|uniref:prolyl aminopeptidase n=1 Tax=Eiseniibacteriota bacterium TaxID=2212470 RepID=A0A7Y2E7X3_UNCEI|nr:alpha/beta fold hydrolase [Candidatus Eisenbacteria bacterium]
MIRIRGLLLVLFLATGCGGGGLETPDISAQTETPSRFPNFLGPCDVVPGALCGTYEVWENRQAAKGRRIELYLVVLPATGEGPVGPPVFPLAGGPGQAAAEGAGFIAGMLSAVRPSHDLVLVDQRGTGSSHPLDCAEPGPDVPLQAVLDDFRSREFVSTCLEAQDADVRFYTTDDAVKDLEEIRQVFGYDQISLTGGSYGTRVALHYLRKYPEHVFAAVLDGVAPPSNSSVAPFAKAFEATLAAVFDACREDPDCRSLIPDPEATWAEALSQFSLGTLTTEATHPGTGQTERVTLVRGDFVDGVRRSLYVANRWPDTMRTILAASKGDFDPYVENEYASQRGIRSFISLGMLLSVSCTESLPGLSDETAVAAAVTGTSLGDHRVRTLREACSAWEHGDLPEGWNDPITSDVPVLMLSGLLDPATPPWLAEEVARHLPNKLHLLIPNRSHGPGDFQCEAAIVQQFLETGTWEGIDTSCINETTLPPFGAVQGEATVEEVTVDVAILETYVGKYQVQPGFAIEIVLEDGQLFAVPPGQPKEQLRPESMDTFYVAGIRQRMTFLKNESGVVDRFTIPNGPTAKRIDP